MNAIAQNRGNIWHVNNLSFDFNTNPVTINSGTGGQTVQSMISDVSGNVIASYNGIDLFDKNNEVVFSNTNFDRGQSSVIVKKPGCNDIYYLFETKTARKPSQGFLNPDQLVPRLFYSSFSSTSQKKYN